MQLVPCSSYDDRVRTIEESRTVVLGNLGGAWLGLVPSGMASFETNVRLPRACGGCTAAIGSGLQVTEEGASQHRHKTCAMGTPAPRWGEDRRIPDEPRGISKRKGSHPRMEKGLASTKSLLKWFSYEE